MLETGSIIGLLTALCILTWNSSQQRKNQHQVQFALLNTIRSEVNYHLKETLREIQFLTENTDGKKAYLEQRETIRKRFPSFFEESCEEQDE